MLLRDCRVLITRASTLSPFGTVTRGLKMGNASCKGGEEVVLCQASDIPVGGMKEVSGESGSVLVVHDAAGFHAVGLKCTHFGAKLSTGALCTVSQRLRCPWHGAAFSYVTGDIEDFPGIDSLPKFNVEVKGDDVVLHVPKDVPLETKRVRGLDFAKGASKGHVVIVGGGASALNCAETLRQEGHSGAITMLTAEDALPYDRTKLSKLPNSKAEALYLRKADHLEKMGIKVERKSEVVELVTSEKVVLTKDGRSISYDKLVLATGGKPRKLQCKGLETYGDTVFYLRSPKDGNALADCCGNDKEREILIIGASFIGMEMAAFLSDKVKKVRVLNRTDQPPFTPVFGEEIGNRVKQMFVEKGVEFEKGSVVEVKGSGGVMTSAMLDSGKEVPAHAVLVGIGVETGLGWLDEELKRGPGGWLSVDGEMRTSVADVWAVGDIVSFPLPLSTNAFPETPVNVQHWQMALKHGQVAARSIAGKGAAIKTVPFFWTMLFGKGIRFAGYNKGYASMEIVGSLEEMKFAAYYFNKSDVLVGVCTMGRDPLAAQIAEAFAIQRDITKAQVLQNPDGDWASLLV